MKNKKDPAFTRKLISLVLPIAFQQFMLALVSASDALMLGVISQDSLSAVSLAGQITFIHNLLLEGNDPSAFRSSQPSTGEREIFRQWRGSLPL